jgi:hypothetical protein
MMAFEFDAGDDKRLLMLMQRIVELEQVCAEAYQFAGALGAPERVLDNLSAAAEGQPLPHESMLPVTAEECDAIGELRSKLDQVRQVLGAA